MSGHIVTLVGDVADETHGRRLAALAAAYGRLAERRRLTTHPTRIADVNPDVILRELGARGRLAVEGDGPWRLHFIPAVESLDALAKGQLPSWGASVDAKHSKAVRQLAGATFRLPFADGDGHVATFIMDWSPFPAACAVAIHPDHSLVRDRPRTARPCFTGRFVRHPLSGDLLPVWVADWVKPEFGTGAVIVNPAHSAADLQFAEEIGLPVRFALGAAEPTANPATWLDPPIVKSGRALRSGRYDGLAHEDAAARYLSDLQNAGHAKTVRFPYLGRSLVATLEADPAASTLWSAALRGFVDDHAEVSDAIAVRSLPTAVLDAAARHTEDDSMLLCSATSITAELLWTRLLLTDVESKHGPATVHAVQRVNPINDKLDPVTMDACLTVVGPCDEVVTVKPQLVEQVQRVLSEYPRRCELHRGQCGALTSLSPPAGKLVAALSEGTLDGTFTHLYALHRALSREQSATAGDRSTYFIGAHVLLGTALPPGHHFPPLSG